MVSQGRVGAGEAGPTGWALGAPGIAHDRRLAQVVADARQPHDNVAVVLGVRAVLGTVQAVKAVGLVQGKRLARGEGGRQGEDAVEA